MYLLCVFRCSIWCQPHREASLFRTTFSDWTMPEVESNPWYWEAWNVRLFNQFVYHRSVFRHFKLELGLYFIVLVLQCVPMQSRISWLSLRIDEIDIFFKFKWFAQYSLHSIQMRVHYMLLYHSKITALNFYGMEIEIWMSKMKAVTTHNALCPKNTGFHCHLFL